MARSKARKPAELSLATLSPEDDILVDIDGTLFRLKSPREFGIADLFELEDGQRRINAMREAMAAGNRSREQAVELHDMLGRLCAALLPEAPLEKIERLPDMERMRLLAFFTNAAAKTKGAAAIPSSESSPGSSASTAEIPAAG